MSYRVFAQPARIELLEQKSRFIGVAEPCSSLDRFTEALAQVTDEFSDATHVTYAYRIFKDKQIVSRFNDAGEPPGTAGKPILSHVEGSGLVNSAVFVVRYFGGVKLGTGGLVKAYGQTAKLVIASTPSVAFEIQVALRGSIPYGDFKQLDYLLGQIGAKITHKSFGEKMEIEIVLPESEKDLFLNDLKNRLPGAQFFPLKIDA